MEDQNKFKLKRMHPAVMGFTVGYGLLALAFMVTGLRHGVLLAVAGVMAAVAILVWCWFRPSYFVVDELGLVLRWPWRRREILKHDILEIGPLERKALGFTVRVGGAGGLWGAFGRFYSFKLGWLDCYLSSNQGIVLLRLKNQRPLLITPERAVEFMEKLKHRAEAPKKRVAIFASGSGSNLQALLDAMKAPDFPAEAVLVVSNKEASYALERGRRAGVTSVFVDPKSFGAREAYDLRLVELLAKAKVDLLCLAGYMRILTPVLVRAYAGRILNIHPALLPKFGGPGMYGHHVHEAVIKAGETKSGASVHFVTEGVDEGAVLLQEGLALLPGETPESLAKRVLEIEHKIYPQALRKVCESLGN
jgi:phosphoribosylglycinamide formyltransferase-1